MAKPFQFILASGNSHKAEEFGILFDKAIIQVSAASEKISVIEDGETFHENALKKAQTYFQRFKRPVLADDSGLVVEALPGELGVQSARFGGEGLTDQQRYELLLHKLEGESNRKAYFVCKLCFYLSADRIFFFEGRLMGSIAHKASGGHGFGYDPVFVPEKGAGESFADNPEYKEKFSHRAVACQLAQAFFKEYNENVDKFEL